MPVPTGHKKILAELCLLLAKIETVSGTDAVPTTQLDAVLAKKVEITPEVNVIPLERVGHTYRAPGGIPAKSSMGYSFEIPFVIEATDTTKMSLPTPPAHVFLRIGGLQALGVQDDTGVSDYHAAVQSYRNDPFDIKDSETLLVSVDGAADQIVTFVDGDFAVPGRGTAAEVIIRINSDVVGATATIFQGRVIIHNDDTTAGKTIQVQAASTANGVLDFPTAEVAGAFIVNRWIYTPQSLACDTTATIDAILFPECADEDDICYRIKMLGCVNNIEISQDRDAESFFKFDGKGAWGAIEEKVWSVIKGVGVRFKARTDAMVAIGASIEFDDYSGAATRADVFSTMGFNFNWEVKERGSQGQERGIHAFYITRKGGPSGTYNPEETMPASVYDRWQAVFDAQRYGMVGIFNSPLGSRATIEVPNLQYGSPKFQRDGVVTLDHEFFPRDNSDDGDDWIKITFEYIAP